MKRRRYRGLITPSRALQIALEDSLISLFIKANFPYPENHPKISSRKWISERGERPSWNVEIIVKCLFPQKSMTEMLTIVLVEVDAQSGKVRSRRFFRNIFDREYRKYLKDNRECQAGFIPD